jgi:hypothetical protein
MTSRRPGDEAPRGDRYAITLCTSTTPMPVDVAMDLALPGSSVFRSRVVEHGRESFRLHLGYFTSAANAEAALGKVRAHYPTAFVTAAPALDSGSLDDTINTAFTLVRSPVAELVNSPEPAPAAPAGSTALPVAGAPAATLTPGQVASVMAPQRYAVQLHWSLQEPGTKPIPRLGIFRAYRLYAVSVMRQGRPEHGLRLGFFKNLEGALQVADYVRHEYPHASVVPVSYREYTRASELTRQEVAAAAEPAARPASSPASAEGEGSGTRDEAPTPLGAHELAVDRDRGTSVIVTAEERAMLLRRPRSSFRNR